MRSWSETFAVYADRRVLRMLFLGFSAGLPLLLVFGTLSVWLKEAELSTSAIGFFSWAALAYGFKVTWAPLVDHLPVPLLGRRLGQRRSWLLVAQLAIVAALVLQALNDPAQSLAAAAGFAVMLAFASATQDIVIDAYRIESAEPDLQAALSSTYIVGYRLGMIGAGAVALEIAGWRDPDPTTYQQAPWTVTYLCMAGLMGVGLVTTLLIPEPATTRSTARRGIDHLRFFLLFLLAAGVFVGSFTVTFDLTAVLRDAWIEAGISAALAGFAAEALHFLGAVAVAGGIGYGLARLQLAPGDLVREAYVDPFAEFLRRYGGWAVWILALIALYRISDVVMGVMANVFYVEVGFEKQVIGRVTKGFGLVMTILGGLVGGLLAYRYGVLRSLFLGALLVAATNALFAVLAAAGPRLDLLIAVISADNLAGGIASAAFVAYLSGLTARGFTATQYALFSSLMLLFPKLVAGYSGMVVEAVGYERFFLGAAALGLPVLLLILIVGRRRAD